MYLILQAKRIFIELRVTELLALYFSFYTKNDKNKILTILSLQNLHHIYFYLTYQKLCIIEVVMMKSIDLQIVSWW